MQAEPTEAQLHPGLAKTFAVLAKTNNQAAIGVLAPGLDSTDPAIQEMALETILERRSATGQREVLRRLHTAPDGWREIIEATKGRVTLALRDALLGADTQMCANACQAILWFREYDLVPALLTACEDEDHPHSQLAGETLAALCDLLFEETSAAPRDCTGRRDPQLVAQRVVSALEASVRRFGQHERHEVINAFLLLCRRENVTLKQILQDPHHGTFVILIDALSHNERLGVIQLLLSFLDDPHLPSAALSVISHRSDARFKQALLRKFAHPISPVTAQNLKRLESLSCLRMEPDALGDLDEMAQHALVQLTVASGIRRGDVFELIEHFLRYGRPAGRIAAARALAHFSNSEAGPLVMYALDDPDPRVQAAVLSQIRERGTPGALKRLIELIDSPHQCVREAARESLAEFSFERYAAAYDMLEDDVRRTTGSLVRKVDTGAIESLVQEFRARPRGRRLRALAIADSMGVIPELESALVELLGDEDNHVRSEAARALGQCRTPTAASALRESLSDRSLSVQEAVQNSLDILECLARTESRAAEGVR